MSGFIGYINNKIDKKILKKMNDKIIHRGPDDEEYYIDKNIGIGYRKLSLTNKKTDINLVYNDKTVVFDGTIFNYEELKEELTKLKYTFTTDTYEELLIYGYETWKKELPKKIRGNFALAIWDSKEKELFLARDPFGTKPLYYYHKDNIFMFVSEIKALLVHPNFEKEFNKEILSSYLCFNSVPTEETFFKNVYRLEPGYSLLFKDNNKEITRFYKLEFNETEEDIDKIIKDIDKAMKESIKYNMISDVEIGSFLSSGIDSSYIVSLAKPKKTFTVGYENPKYDEIKYAKDLSDKLGIENKSKIIKKEEYIKVFPNIMYHMDEPLADPACPALYFGIKEASKDVKIIMSGEGADELFGGYNIYQTEIDSSLYLKVPYFIRNILYRISSIFPDMRGFNFLYRNGQKLEDHNIGIGRVFRDKEAISIVNNKNQIKTKDITKPYYEEYKNNSNIVKRQVIDIYFWLVRDFLHLVDRNASMFSLEGRVPFLDKAVVDIASNLGVNAKINKETTKIALRKAAQKVIPNEAYKKKKLGFPVPLRDWVKEEDLYKEILSKFESDTAKKYFNQKKIIKLLNDHKNNKKDNYKKVWTIYTFLVWYEQFF